MPRPLSSGRRRRSGRPEHPAKGSERLFYHSEMPIPPTGLSRDWIEAEASLPVGWRVSGLVREPDESWRAWALPSPHRACRWRAGDLVDLVVGVAQRERPAGRREAGLVLEFRSSR